jgi:hypothetical protein
MAVPEQPKGRTPWIIGLVLLAIVIVIALWSFTGAGPIP